MSSTNISDNKDSCSCEITIKFLREQIELLKRENEDLEYEGYTLRKGQRPLKEKLEIKTQDFRKLQEDYSNKCECYNFIEKQLAIMTAELDALKNKFENVDFNFRKFDVSSKVVA